MPLHGVIFDMGGTLLHYTPPGEHWEGMEKRGAQHVYHQLAAQGYALPAWDYAQALWMNLDAHDVKDLKLYKLMRHILALWNVHDDLPQASIEALGLAPQEAVYVGDSLYFDVWGAQQAGLRGVWIEQSTRRLPEGIDVTPDATITRLPDLLPLVQGWRE